jgi:4-amino-4-deoxy-L-arabinose transferase-like glycosyltransferase
MRVKRSLVQGRSQTENTNDGQPLSISQKEAVTRPKRWFALLKRHWLFLLIFLLAFFFITINVNQPWATAYEDNGLAFSSIAVNQIRFGLGYTKGQSVADRETLNADLPKSIPGVPASQEFQYLLTGPIHPFFYCDHPPLLGLTIAGAFEIFGYDFWVVRLVSLVYSLATLVLFYLLVTVLFDRVVAQFASFLYATFPMMAYYGRNVAHEAPTLFWTVALLTGYVHWQRSEKLRWLILMVASIVIGGFYGWPMFYFSCILFLVDWITSRRFNRALALTTVLPAVLTFGLVFAQIYWALDGNLKPVLDVFVMRTGSKTYGSAPTGILNDLLVLWHLNAKGYARWSTLVLPLVAVFLVRRGRAEGWSLRIRVLVMTFLFGLSHILIFPGGALFHVYWQFYFLPFYSLSIGWAGVALVRNYIHSTKLRTVVIGASVVGVLALSWPFIFSLYTTGSGVFIPIIKL